MKTMFAVLLLLPLRLTAQPDTSDTRLLHSPAVSRDHIAFLYAGDLWICDLDGRNVRRLTSDPGIESNPVFSPDGRTIAFSGEYGMSNPRFGDPGLNVYTIPVEGGEPRRLTWHPGFDIVRGWTPDGRSVLFSSWREVSMGSDTPLFTVPAGGGFPERLPVPHGHASSFSPDGGRIAYMPQRDVTGQRKNYRGGTHARIWILSLKDLGVEQLPQPAGSFNDIGPRWMGDSIYFRSDRDGELNLYVHDTKTRAVRRLTSFEDFPVLNLDAGGGNVVFEQAGYLHRFDPATGRSERLKIGVAAELPETRPRFARGAKEVRNGHISPSGARAVFQLHGEVVTVPAAKGDPRDLTNTPGIHERHPVWSPDGESIAYFSDEGGEYALHVRPADGKGKARVYKVAAGGYYDTPVWSPDSKKIAYVDTTWTLRWLDLANGSIRKIATEPIYGVVRSLRAAWSPDSKWIAYALGNLAAYRTVHIYSLEKDESRAITDGMSDATDPVFDASGKYLYFLASTDAGPVNHWFNLSSTEMRATRSLYLALLRKDTPSPFLRESDEEEEAKTAEPEKPGPVRIDFDGLDRRLLPFPLPNADYRTLAAGEAGQVLYLSQAPVGPGVFANRPAAAALMRYDLDLPHLATNEDLYRVLRWMLSELSVSHSVVEPPAGEPKEGTGGGLLGADFEVANGRYRFKKVYDFVMWWPNLRAPLGAPGVEVKAGEYLLAVRGVDLRPPTDVYEPFANTGNENVEITVGPNPDGSGSRTVTVVPLANLSEELRLRRRAWIEGNRKRVEQATGGRVAYVYLPDTSPEGLAWFKRFFYAQIDKDAVILDERYNGGGAWADYYLDHLRRPFSSFWAMRHGPDFRSPSAAIHGPKVMIINEQAGSGGDGLPWMFRQSKLGALVGKRTWGGEVGTLDYPELIDGGYVSAPNFALWSPDGGWVVENEGVAPDFEVEQWPKDLLAGRDPQLEKAIEVVLEELKKNPPARPQRPPYPVRVRGSQP